uniref:Uncharacterized protein n=1 Tax=Rhizophora mucronata TaxID=61149 RepID=A0A2P2IZI7_RHIMU
MKWVFCFNPLILRGLFCFCVFGWEVISSVIDKSVDPSCLGLLEESVFLSNHQEESVSPLVCLFASESLRAS